MAQNSRDKDLLGSNSTCVRIHVGLLCVTGLVQDRQPLDVGQFWHQLCALAVELAGDVASHGAGLVEDEAVVLSDHISALRH